MNSNRFSKLTGVILFTILAVKMMGCGLFNDKAQLVPELTMKVENMELSQGESIDVVLDVKNPSNETLIIKTSCKEFAGLFTYHENKRIDFAGNNTGCARMINTYEIAPNGALTFNWEVGSSIVSWDQETATTDTTLATPGQYLIQIRINALSVNGQEYNFTALEQMLTIR